MLARDTKRFSPLARRANEFPILRGTSAHPVIFKKAIPTMNRLRTVWLVWPLLAANATSAFAEETTFLLQPTLQTGDAAVVEIGLEVGGDMLVKDDMATADTDEKAVKKLPLSVVANLRYEQHLLHWSADTSEIVRALRYYDAATATIKIDGGGMKLTLPEDKRLMLTEVRDARSALNGLWVPLTRDDLDLVRVVGNPLVVDRLLPGGELAEGDSWDHDTETIGELLGMDHVAVCEVRSVVTGEENRQVKLRLAGTVHGTIDGAATEIELRGAYLFHMQFGRITKLNLAIKELRTTGEVTPGLDIVAKLKLQVKPVEVAQHIDERAIATAEKLAGPVSHELLYLSPDRGLRFRYDTDWYITAEQRELVALRRLQDGTLIAHCNLTTLPARSAGRETTLEGFERDVRRSLGDHLEEVAAATKWTNHAGHTCLGIIANGKVKEVPIQWRYYLIASAGQPQVSLEVTVEHSQVEQFDNADRHIVDSMELIDIPADKGVNEKTASKPAMATPK